MTPSLADKVRDEDFITLGRDRSAPPLRFSCIPERADREKVSQVHPASAVDTSHNCWMYPKDPRRLVVAEGPRL